MKNAQESAQVRKARKKLEEQFREESSKVTPEALKNVQDKIYRWIERHSKDRVNLRDKNVAVYTLFDGNQNPAKTVSKYIEHLRGQIHQELAAEAKDAAVQLLKGRITKADKTFSNRH